MIRTSVSAVFQVRDGFTGRIVEGSSLACLLDGVPAKLIAKPGGYLVATDLCPGTHQLVLRSAVFQEERIDFSVSPGSIWEGYISLKPSSRYLFRQNVTQLHLDVSALPAPVIWITGSDPLECKIAQTKAETGAEEFRIYCKGGAALLPIPGPFLIEDGEKSEIVIFRSLAEDMVSLAAPLAGEHSRSKRLLSVQPFRPDENGQIFAAFPAAGEVVVYPQGGSPSTHVLVNGENRIKLNQGGN